MSSPLLKSDKTVAVSDGWENVCLVDDLVNGSGVCVLFDHKQVAIFCVGKANTLYAISNFDPFSEANVLSRGIIGSLKDKTVVASPIFKQHFCLETGVCIEDESIQVDAYTVRVEGSHVQLQRIQ